jgi:hypothetical protein
VKYIVLLVVLFSAVSATAQRKDSEPEVFLYASGAVTASLGLNLLNGIGENPQSNQRIIKYSVKLVTLSVFSFTTAIVINKHKKCKNLKHKDYAIWNH